MKLLEKLSIRKSEVEEGLENGSVSGQNGEQAAPKPAVRSAAAEDPLNAKVVDVVQQLIESREQLKLQIEERDRGLVELEDRIRELQYDKSFLEQKLDSAINEKNRAQANATELKSLYEQLLADYNATRLQQENKIRELQERLTERELTNRQLMLDLNRNQKDFEFKQRELENREREKEVKIQHLEQKLRQEQRENERLTQVIGEFASQAISTAKLARATEQAE